MDIPFDIHQGLGIKIQAFHGNIHGFIFPACREFPVFTRLNIDVVHRVVIFRKAGRDVVGHFFFLPFYVYAYSFADCLVNSLYQISQEGKVKNFADKYSYFDKLDEEIEGEDEDSANAPSRYEEEFGDVDGQIKFIPDGGMPLNEEVLMIEDDLDDSDASDFDDFTDDVDGDDFGEYDNEI